MLISVIIPVYNIRNYIEDCIQSIVQQTYKNWECILVDDGSTDGSEKVCDFYADKFEKITVIHKENGGLSSARNAGLRIANGDYVYFLDGDDMLKPEALEHFYLNAESGKVDIVIGHMSYFYGENDAIPFGNIVKKEWVLYKSGKIAFLEIHKHNPTFMMGVRGLYKKEFLLKNALFFNEKDCWYSEDQEWTVRCFECAQSVSSNELPDYLYRTGRPDSLMNTPNIKKIESTLRVYDSWYEKCMLYQTEEFYSVLYDILIKRFWNIFIQYSGLFTSESLKEFCSIMDKRRRFVKNRPLGVSLDKYSIIMYMLKSKHICRLLKLKGGRNM